MLRSVSPNRPSRSGFLAFCLLSSFRTCAAVVPDGCATLAMLEETVAKGSVCDLPGCPMKLDVFIPLLKRAQSRGYVMDRDADYVLNGFTQGFDLGVRRELLFGTRVFSNYPATMVAKDSVNAAISSRVARQKTIMLGPWGVVRDWLVQHFGDFYVFPMGAVPKPHQPEVMRPTSDHTRTGLNAATILGILGHSLDAYKRLEYLFSRQAWMTVADVDDAFSFIPLVPWLWAYMLFRWFDVDDSDRSDRTLYVYAHLFADFGTRGAPGTFKIILVNVFVGIAQSEFVLTIPIVVYVDDVALIAEDAGTTNDSTTLVKGETRANEEMSRFQDFSLEMFGLVWKAAKLLTAAQIQLYIGFWWNSLTLTRELPAVKLSQYTHVLLEASVSPSLTLRDRQSLAGKMQRAIMTFPPLAACLIVNSYIMASGLLFPWQRRRTSRNERCDYKFVHDMLELNAGRGYYSYDNFSRGVEFRSDACKSRALTGGGWVVNDGTYSYYTYGSAASRKPIDYLEGDSVIRCCKANAHKWHGCIVRAGIDNTSFENSLEAGRSKVARLNDLIRCLLALQIEYEFIIEPYWISSGDNLHADLLSRQKIEDFLEVAHEFVPPNVPLSEHASAGTVATFADCDYTVAMGALRRTLKTFPSNYTGDGASSNSAITDHRAPLVDPALHGLGHSAANPYGNSASHASVSASSLLFFLLFLTLGVHAPTRGAGVGGDAQLLSIPYDRTSVFDGCPHDLLDRLDEIMDNRLRPSSLRKAASGFKRWTEFCDQRGWPHLMPNGLRARGGRMAAWILSMVDDTVLVFASISVYVWGMRTMHTLHHLSDPAMGVEFFRELMRAASVLTSVPGTPRKRIEHSVIDALLRDIYENHWDSRIRVQLGLVVLVLYFTFSRTECPCPKTFSGQDSWDPSKHWQVGDFALRRRGEFWVLWVRFKAIKQDPRLERPGARHEDRNLPDDLHSTDPTVSKDWVPLGDVPSVPHFSVALFYMRFVQLVGRSRTPDEPMFLAADGVRPYTYAALNSELTSACVAHGGTPEDKAHGLRVAGYFASKRANGEDLTVAHGGWSENSDGHSRYDRFVHSDVLGVPAGMVGADSVFGGVRVISTASRASRGAPSMPVDPTDEESDGSDDGGGAAVASAPPASSRDLPPGFTHERRVTSSGRAYSMFFSREGRRFESLVACWRYATTPPDAPTAPEASVPVAPASVPPAVPAVVPVVPPAVPAVAPVLVSPPSRSRVQPRRRQQLCGEASTDGVFCTHVMGHLGLHSFEVDDAPRRA